MNVDRLAHIIRLDHGDLDDFRFVSIFIVTLPESFRGIISQCINERLPRRYNEFKHISNVSKRRNIHFVDLLFVLLIVMRLKHPIRGVEQILFIKLFTFGQDLGNVPENMGIVEELVIRLLEFDAKALDR